MGSYHERVRLELTPGEFVLPSAERMKAAMRALNMALELPAATWEPHDWRDFD